ncbi:hypothetical protein [Frankia sp. AgB32]|uniref:hypothetical protein n=1 Tax=Frankia sp. AgB32 TaxID=631119 RepID=UPI002010844E|nr:hypothetical protein [Frankia sp. AgB32]MCK9894857.1 hypothetical protein [Frankia sp. AgB32]
MTVALNARASSGLPLTYERVEVGGAQQACQTVQPNGVVPIVGRGKCLIRISQAGNDSFPPVTRSVEFTLESAVTRYTWQGPDTSSGEDFYLTVARASGSLAAAVRVTAGPCELDAHGERRKEATYPDFTATRDSAGLLRSYRLHGYANLAGAAQVTCTFELTAGDDGNSLNLPEPLYKTVTITP